MRMCWHFISSRGELMEWAYWDVFAIAIGLGVGFLLLMHSL
jgi:hypothetical protein